MRSNTKTLFTVILAATLQACGAASLTSGSGAAEDALSGSCADVVTINISEELLYSDSSSDSDSDSWSDSSSDSDSDSWSDSDSSSWSGSGSAGGQNLAQLGSSQFSISLPEGESVNLEFALPSGLRIYAVNAFGKDFTGEIAAEISGDISETVELPQNSSSWIWDYNDNDTNDWLSSEDFDSTISEFKIRLTALVAGEGDIGLTLYVTDGEKIGAYTLVGIIADEGSCSISLYADESGSGSGPGSGGSGMEGPGSGLEGGSDAGSSNEPPHLSYTTSGFSLYEGMVNSILVTVTSENAGNLTSEMQSGECAMYLVDVQESSTTFSVTLDPFYNGMGFAGTCKLSIMTDSPSYSNVGVYIPYSYLGN